MDPLNTIRCYYVGIDPSLNSTGIALRVHSGISTIHRYTGLIKQTSLTGLERLLDNKTRLLVFLHTHLPENAKITTICMEGASHASTGRHDELGKNRGILSMALLETYGVTPIEVPPSRVKKFATRHGDASKNKMIDYARLAGWDIPPDSDDEADAAHLADIAAALNGILPAVFTRQQLEVIRDMGKVPAIKSKRRRSVP